MIPYGRQDISDTDISAVIDVLRSDFLTQGPAVPHFEGELCRIAGCANAVAVNSATSALHIACLALGVGEGDLVWTTPITFVASANAARYCGADVDFVDIDPDSCNMCPDRLREKLEQASATGRLPKVVIPVHLAGRSCDMARIHAECRRFGIRVIEDASHAIGGTYEGRPVGNCAYSDITVFSFHPVKIVTTGEGGAALTNDADLAAKMRLARSHGVTREQRCLMNPDEGAWYYEQQSLGYNYRMTDIAAALGTSQLLRLDSFLSSRRALAASYDTALAGLPIDLPSHDEKAVSAWHLYIVRVPATVRRAVFDHLRSRGISVNVHYIPVYHHPYYRALGFDPRYCPHAESYYAQAISLPMYPALSDRDRDFVVAALAECLRS
jgi:UDP-4-amino-4,6-dideoxy-N-acetyl-beta-L-altrosamine transaminase